MGPEDNGRKRVPGPAVGVHCSVLDELGTGTQPVPETALQLFWPNHPERSSSNRSCGVQSLKRLDKIEPHLSQVPARGQVRASSTETRNSGTPFAGELHQGSVQLSRDSEPSIVLMDPHPLKPSYITSLK